MIFLYIHYELCIVTCSGILLLIFVLGPLKTLGPKTTSVLYKEPLVVVTCR